MGTFCVVVVATALFVGVQSSPGAKADSDSGCMVDWLSRTACISREKAVSYEQALSRAHLQIESLKTTSSVVLGLIGIGDEEHQAKILQCARDGCFLPCRHGGKCVQGNGTYSCRCAAGYGGKRCEKDLCEPNPCSNSGTCKRNAPADFRCICQAGYEGRTCSQRVVSNSTCACTKTVKTLTATVSEIAKAMERLHARLAIVEGRHALQMAGWSYFAQTRCFYKLLSQQSNFDQARRSCQAAHNGSDLVIIKSAEENAYIKVLVKGHFPWIGATDREQEGTWKWWDGSRVTYTDWGQGEPNGGRRENCAHFWKESVIWNDTRCNVQRRAVCEVCV